MAEVQIPSAYRAALVKLAEYDDAQIRELCSLLETHPEILTSRQVALDQASKLTKLGPDEGYAVLEAVIPLLYFRASHADSVEEVLKEVTAAIIAGGKNENKLAASAIPKFRHHLGLILALSSVTEKAKALSVATDSQRLFSQSKILSDMRPVFGEKVTDAPLGVVILHSLKIEFAENGKEKEFFVCLNSADLTELQACIARALEKEASLRKVIENWKLRLFETSA